jgi:hypothetical protein
VGRRATLGKVIGVPTGRVSGTGCDEDTVAACLSDPYAPRLGFTYCFYLSAPDDRSQFGSGQVGLELVPGPQGGRDPDVEHEEGVGVVDAGG